MSLTRSSALRFVWLIGLVSFFADMTYQGAHGNAGPYLALLGASGTVVGFVAGAGEFVNYGLRLVFGYWTDRTRKYWWSAFPGYAINLIAVPALALTHHWWTAAGLLILERTGKGMRTPARDVMLSHAAEQVGRGWAFGLHEAMDQAGGMMGPLLVAGVLFENRGYHASFAVLAIPAFLALVCLVATWLQFPHPEELEGKKISLEAAGLPRTYWVFIAGVACLAAGYADFALMAFHFKKQSMLSAGWIPVAYALAMGLQGLSSLGFGRLFDRWGIGALLAATLSAATFAPLVFFGTTHWALFGLALWTLGLGAQSSIMKAAVAGIVSAERRGSAYGILNSIYGLSWFAGSALMGWLYDHALTGLVLFSIITQLAAVPLLLALM